MSPRAGFVGTLCLVALAAAPAAGAARARLTVEPARPYVGVRASIEVQTTAAAPVYAQIVSPTGVKMRVRMTRVLPGLWRVRWHFADDGQWLVRVPRAAAATRVHVVQPPGILPPFNPNKLGGSKTGALSGLAGPGIVFGR
jgi:hypothetical protein